MPLKPLAPTEVSITGNRSLTSVLFSRAQTGIKQIVHCPRRPLREINFAKHDRSLLIGFESAANAGKTKRYVLANFVDKIGPRQHIGDLLAVLRAGVGLSLTVELGFRSPTFLAAQVIEAHVSRDAEDPGLESRFSTKSRQAFEHAHDHLLQQVLGVLTQRDHSIHIGKERLAKRFNQFRESALVTVKRALNQ